MDESIRLRRPGDAAPLAEAHDLPAADTDQARGNTFDNVPAEASHGDR